MTAILFLFAVAGPGTGGLGLGTATAGALVGAYIAGVFICSMPGAWVGDRMLGTYRATLYGGVLIAAGHATLAVPVKAAFPLGLLLVALGTGLLKPNLTVLLGSCYPRDAHTTRESAFSVFYMSIQISAIIAPLVTGFLGEYYNWHAGFGAASLGMALGVACFLWGRRYLGDVGDRPCAPVDPALRRRLLRRAAVAVSVLFLLVLADWLSGSLRAQHLIATVGVIGLALPPLAFRSIGRDPRVRPQERARVRTFVWVFLASAWFWMLFTQSLSLLSGFAKDNTTRLMWGFHVPAAWFQSLQPLFILLGAPVAAWLWPRLRDQAGVAVKMASGLALAGLAFLLMGVAAHLAQHGPVSPGWLTATYALLSAGELALAPVGLSVTIAAAPEAFASQMMGLWWLSAALGAGIGGQIVRLAVVLPTDQYYAVFGILSVLVAGVLVASRARLAGLLNTTSDPTRVTLASAPIPS